jgi:hypothetical protein
MSTTRTSRRLAVTAMLLSAMSAVLPRAHAEDAVPRPRLQACAGASRLVVARPCAGCIPDRAGAGRELPGAVPSLLLEPPAEFTDFVWLARIRHVLRANDEDYLPEVGKYNAGQNSCSGQFVLVGVLFVTGVGLWSGSSRTCWASGDHRAEALGGADPRVGGCAQPSPSGSSTSTRRSGCAAPSRP